MQWWWEEDLLGVTTKFDGKVNLRRTVPPNTPFANLMTVDLQYLPRFTKLDCLSRD